MRPNRPIRCRSKSTLVTVVWLGRTTAAGLAEAVRSRAARAAQMAGRGERRAARIPGVLQVGEPPRVGAVRWGSGRRVEAGPRGRLAAGRGGLPGKFVSHKRPEMNVTRPAPACKQFLGNSG